MATPRPAASIASSVIVSRLRLRKEDELLNHDLDIPGGRVRGFTDGKQAHTGGRRCGSRDADCELSMGDRLGPCGVSTADRRERRLPWFTAERMRQTTGWRGVAEHIVRNILELQDVLRVLVVRIAPGAHADVQFTMHLSLPTVPRIHDEGSRGIEIRRVPDGERIGAISERAIEDQSRAGPSTVT